MCQGWFFCLFFDIVYKNFKGIGFAIDSNFRNEYYLFTRRQLRLLDSIVMLDISDHISMFSKNMNQLTYNENGLVKAMNHF